MLKVVSTIGFQGGTPGALVYRGTWDADTNTPNLQSGVGDKGDYYVVNVAGSTDLDGITDWEIGDWAIFNGTVWEKIDNSEPDPLIVNDLTAANVSITNSLSANLASSNTAAMPDPSLPLNPEGYISVVINGTTKKIPYYGV